MSTTPGRAACFAGVDRDDPRPRHVERNEFHVKHSSNWNVGEKLLAPSYAFAAAEATHAVPDPRCKFCPDGRGGVSVLCGTVSPTLPAVLRRSSLSPARPSPPPGRQQQSDCSRRNGKGFPTKLRGSPPRLVALHGRAAPWQTSACQEYKIRIVPHRGQGKPAAAG